MFIGLSETWLSNQKDAELAITGYRLFRADRHRIRKSKKGRDSGGVALYIRNDIADTCEQILHSSDGVIEILTVYSRKENIIICVVYRQPDDSVHGHSSKSKEFIATLTKLKESILSIELPTPDIILGGDFNLPHTTWPECSPKMGCPKEERVMIDFLHNFKEELLLTQHVMYPTHKDGNTLDLVFTNNSQLIHNYNCTEILLSISHHKIIEISTTYKTTFNYQNKKEQEKKFNSVFENLNFFSEDINWDELNKYLLDYDWHTDFRGKSTEETLYSVIQDVSSEYVPRRKQVKRLKAKYQEKELT